MLKGMIDRGEPLPPKYKLGLFADAPEVELIWQGKTNEVANIVLPFQVIEQIDEPRAEEASGQPQQLDMFSVDTSTGRQSGGWTNKLVWGDNKLVLSSLKNGPLRREIENAGGLKLIYIDPPFDVGADFSVRIEIGDDAALTKQPSVIEELGYRDTWGLGTDSYLAMISERLRLMRDLMAEDGSLFIHQGPATASAVRLAGQEIFGAENLVSEIIWIRSDPHNDARNKLGVTTDRILWFSKSSSYFYDAEIEREPLSVSGESEYSRLELSDGSVVPYRGNEHLEGRRFKLTMRPGKGIAIGLYGAALSPQLIANGCTT
jgi:hypothetical protein